MKFKELLKNKFVIGGAASVLVVAGVVAAVLLIPHDTTPLETASGPDASDVSIQPPSVSTPESTGSATETESTASGNEAGSSDIKVELEPQTPATSSKPTGNGDSSKAEQPAKPVAPAEPEQPGNEGGIQIGGGGTPEKYSCGVKNHHCKSPGAHAFISNLELEGCPHCGSHACPSFYATDEWGGAMYNAAKCPQYDVKKDPLKYCQKCGREMWSQSNPAGCFSYLQDTQCECGELVEGNTCHHH